MIFEAATRSLDRSGAKTGVTLMALSGLLLVSIAMVDRFGPITADNGHALTSLLDAQFTASCVRHAIDDLEEKQRRQLHAVVTATFDSVLPPAYAMAFVSVTIAVWRSFSMWMVFPSLVALMTDGIGNTVQLVLLADPNSVETLAEPLAWLNIIKIAACVVAIGVPLSGAVFHVGKGASPPALPTSD